MIYRFEGFALDTSCYELRRGGELVSLEPQTFEVLSYLVEHADRVARKEDLLAAVWGTTFVSDAALTTRIKDARHALGDDGRSQRFIRTVHGHGYRFVGTLGNGVQPAAADLQPGRVRFARASDGVHVAFATTGDGPPLVKVANWITHLEYDEQSPVWRHMVRDLSEGWTFVRYDERGSGLSDREASEDWFSVEAWVRDLSAVVDTLGLERFPLLAISQGGAVALAYAHLHPERVSHLVLYNAYARGAEHRGEASLELHRALQAIAHEGWGHVDSAHAQLFAARMIPRGSQEQLRWLVELQRVSASRDAAVRFRQAFGDIDVEHLLPEIRVPTLVLHSQRDQNVPFEEGRLLAAGIAGARLVPLDSDNHVILEDEPAWPRLVSEIRSFVQG